MTNLDVQRDDFDSPWKEALEHYFPDFLALLFPRIHCDIDWAKGYGFLDTELQQVVRDAELGRRLADKLIQVHTLDGAETWVLIHVEVQGEAHGDFAERMYVYNYRLFDRYRVDIVSLAVLTDDSSNHRPRGYRRARWGCNLLFRFPIHKLLDWETRWAELEADPNPFTLVVMAQIKARESKDGLTRKGWKWHLVRLLYQRGYSREQVLALFRLIDWMLRLPEALEREFLHELIAFEEEANMPYVTNVERLSHEDGRLEGRLEGRQEGEAALLLHLLTLKFGAPSATVRQRIQGADPETLLRWSARVLTATNLNEVLQDGEGR